MEMIISLKENVDFNKLTIETNNKDFDKKAFETIVKKSIEKFLEDIKLNDQLLQTALKSMLDEASSQECNKENIILENITIK
jgi:hypothetical protein